MKNDVLKSFKKQYISEELQEITGIHENELFFDCTFHKLSGLTLKNCDLNQSRFTTKRVRDALGLTLTLDCHSFSGVEFSPELFDMMLALLTLSKGNDSKKEKLVDIIGQKKYTSLYKLLKVNE